jgi:membrane protein implicated in regulation of membrane protease activity
MIFFWFGVSLFFLLLEMGSPGLFFFLSFFLGALVSGCVALIVTPSLIIQGVVFLGSSLAAFFVLHYWVKKGVRETAVHKTNIFTLQGKHGLIIKEIRADEVGLVKVGGETWSARSVHNQPIKIGTKVTVVQVRGAHLIVRDATEN